MLGLQYPIRHPCSHVVGHCPFRKSKLRRPIPTHLHNPTQPRLFSSPSLRLPPPIDHSLFLSFRPSFDSHDCFRSSFPAVHFFPSPAISSRHFASNVRLCPPRTGDPSLLRRTLIRRQTWPIPLRFDGIRRDPLFEFASNVMKRASDNPL